MNFHKSASDDEADAVSIVTVSGGGVSAERNRDPLRRLLGEKTVIEMTALLLRFL